MLEEFLTYGDQSREWSSYTVDGYYRWTIDTSGQQLSLDASSSFYRREAVNLLRTEGGDYDTRRNSEPAETRITVAQLDYKRPLGETWQLQAGGKYSAARLDNELQATLLRGGAWEVDGGLSNRFLYDENIAAGYVNLVFEKEKWEANIGLRYEDTQTDGYSVTLDSTVARDFSQLFPSLSVSAPLAGKLGVSLAYSYRIERPSYFTLNPFIAYLDPYTYEVGNPFLRPELTHSGQLSITYEKQPFLNLQYDLTNDIMAEVTEQDDVTGRGFATTVNLDRYVRYGGSLFFPLDFIAKPLSGYGGVMVFYHDYASDYLGGRLDQDQWSITAFLNASIKLPADWKFELNGWYQGAGVDGIMTYKPLYGVDAGLEKTFLDDQLRLQLSADGIVQQFWRGRVDYQNMDFDILSQWEAPILNMRLTYSFGNRFLKRENRRGVGAEERQRVQMKE